MERNFSEDEIDQFLMAIGAKTYGGKKSSKNLYRILGATPETDDDGNRVPTPYEVLSVPPQFRDGVEVPIVFAIKNRVSKIGHFTGPERLFYYAKKNKVKSPPSIEATLNELKRKYKRAVFMGNLDEAAAYLDMVNSISGGRAEEVMGFFYNYAVFYRRMKRQLLMDMFSHFFLTYIFKYRTYIKEGIMDTKTHFKPYIEKQTFTLSTAEIKDFSNEAGILDSSKSELGNIKEFKFEMPEIEFSPAPVIAPQPVKMPEIKPQEEQTPVMPKESQEQETQRLEKKLQELEQQSFIKHGKNVRPSFLERFGLNFEEDTQEEESPKQFNFSEESKTLDK